MYGIGELIVYGGTGVCRVENIRPLSLKGADRDKKYYVLKPLYQDGTIYAPVEGKVFMRPVISRGEAEELIAMIPTIKAEAVYDKNFNQLASRYDEVLGTHDCADLVELMMSIYAKKKHVEQQKRKFGQIDARYMKRAEGLLYGELAVALDMPRDDVPDYIGQKVAESKRSRKEKS